MIRDKFVQQVKNLIDTVQSEEEQSLDEAVKKLVDTIQKDGLIYLFGCGHSHILTEDMCFRAGGLACVYPILYEPLMLHEGAVTSSRLEKENDYAEKFIDRIQFKKQDSLIAISTSGINPVTIDVALAAKKSGTGVIVITSKEYSFSQPSRHKAKYRLADVGDVVIDNHIPIGDALMSYSKNNVKFGSASTIVGDVILQSVFSETIYQLYSKGVKPPIFLSGNLENSSIHNQKLIDQYQKRIPILK